MAVPQAARPLRRLPAIIIDSDDSDNDEVKDEQDHQEPETTPIGTDEKESIHGSQVSDSF